MRLINTDNLRFEQVNEGDRKKSYAILSHRWRSGSDGEATLQQFQHFKDSCNVLWDPQIRAYRWIDNAFDIHPGIQKVLDFCSVAKTNGWEWAWVDTVCIDKTSSAELSESINSMFKWYQSATICFVHLSDFNTAQGMDGLKKSEWFRRGWTLQELIAPSQIYFYDSSWTFFMNKLSHATELRSITGIPEGAISGRSVHSYSAAQRMSWAAKRNTTRPEDGAYCLLGLLGVNMELLYGEGARKSFERLQIKFLEEFEDESLFAWSSSTLSSQASLKTELSIVDERNRMCGTTSMDCDFTGILALSPKDFADSGHIRVAKIFAPESPVQVSNRGLELRRDFYDIGRCTVSSGYDYDLPLLLMRIGCASEGSSQLNFILLAQDFTSLPIIRWCRMIPREYNLDQFKNSMDTWLRRSCVRQCIYARLSWPNIGSFTSSADTRTSSHRR